MAATAILSSRDVPTTFNYYAPIGTEVPFQYTYKRPDGQPQDNIGKDTRPAVVHDARGKEAELGLSLDTSGFQFVKHESVEKDFINEDRIKEVYYKEVEELLKKEVGAKRVFIFDHTIRRKPSDNAAPLEAQRGPVERVHIDQTYDASVRRVYRHLGDDAERLLKGRVRIINVWRPIKNPVAHKPLGVSDWRYLDREHDLVPSRLIYPDKEGAVYMVKYNPQHRWYYLSDQTPSEVTLIKCYDSEVDKARLTPHSAFPDASASPEAPHRESIEVRVIVFDTE
ncbi:hypothetical protein BC835DRAFT_1421791 [Cytidiella melzeri]|nr:hypothetical protein BC835DRAFT_1421791 [Cytidiella melzeri]